MATQQFLIRLPGDLARRLKRQVPAHQRSLFVQRLLEQALPPDKGENGSLCQAALAVERDEHLTAKMVD